MLRWRERKPVDVGHTPIVEARQRASVQGQCQDRDGYSADGTVGTCPGDSVLYTQRDE